MVSPGDWQDGCVRRYVTGRWEEGKAEERRQTQEETGSEMEPSRTDPFSDIWKKQL